MNIALICVVNIIQDQANTIRQLSSKMRRLENDLTALERGQGTILTQIVYVYIYVLYTCIHYTYIYIHLCVYIYNSCSYIYIHMHIHIHMHTSIYILTSILSI